MASITIRVFISRDIFSSLVNEVLFLLALVGSPSSSSDLSETSGSKGKSFLGLPFLRFDLPLLLSLISLF